MVVCGRCGPAPRAARPGCRCRCRGLARAGGSRPRPRRGIARRRRDSPSRAPPRPCARASGRRAPRRGRARAPRPRWSRSRATFEAKQATATRFLSCPTSLMRASRTSASEPLSPSTERVGGIAHHRQHALVAEAGAAPPRRSSGRRAGRGRSSSRRCGGPCPAACGSTTALGSGIECVSVISSSSNGPSENLPDIGTTVIGTSSRSSAFASFARSTEAVKGVA